VPDHCPHATPVGYIEEIVRFCTRDLGVIDRNLRDLGVSGMFPV